MILFFILCTIHLTGIFVTNEYVLEITFKAHCFSNARKYMILRIIYIIYNIRKNNTFLQILTVSQHYISNDIFEQR